MCWPAVDNYHAVMALSGAPFMLPGNLETLDEASMSN